jgi:hypothetical protein
MSKELREERQLRERLEGESVMPGGAVQTGADLMLLGAVAGVGLPAATGMARREALHQEVAARMLHGPPRAHHAPNGSHS